MIPSKRSRAVSFLAAGALALAACGGSSSDDSADTTAAEATDTTVAEATDTTAAEAADTTAAEAADTTEAAAAEGWAVSTDDCADPEAATAAIEGELLIGGVMPLSNSPAAAAFAPVKDGFESYIAYANEQGLVPGVTLAVQIEDDQYNKDLTPGAVDKLLDAGAAIFSGIIGTPNNASVRDILNEECVPQLNALTGDPRWGEVEDYPWTTGVLIPYTIETQGYLGDIVRTFPDGTEAAVFYTNNEFGEIYNEAFNEGAADAGVTIVDTQTVEAADGAPPTAQLNSIASKAPAVIMAAPLGAQCASFLAELANAKAATPGWEPRVYISNTCASALILGLAGDAANGLYTSASGGLSDVGSPDVQAANPAVKAYVDYMTAAGFAETYTTAGAGWNAAEVTVAILAQAAASEAGLSRASIIDAARNFDYAPSLAREGVTYTSSGTDDPYLATAIQIVQYDATAKTFADVGELIVPE